MRAGTRNVLWLAGGPVAILLLVLIGLALTVNHSRTELAKYKEKLKNQSEPLSRDDLVPKSTPSDPDKEAFDDAVKTLRDQDALRSLPFRHEEDRGATRREGRSLVVHEQAALHRDKMDLPWETLEKKLAPQQPQLDTIRRVVSPSHKSLGLGFFPGHFGNFFRADTAVRLRQKDIPGAVANIETLLSLAAISAKYSIFPRTTEAIWDAEFCTWETLQNSEVNADSLIRMQKAWEAVRPGEALARGIRAQRAFTATFFSSNRPSSRTTPGIQWPGTDLVWLAIFRYADELEFLTGSQRILDQIPPGGEPPYPALLKVAEEQTLSLTDHEISRGTSLAASKSLTKMISDAAMTDSVRALAITAIALRRYQLDHAGNLPATLEELAPDYLIMLPRDPMNGQILHYLPGESEYLLYAVGLNGLDDKAVTTSGFSKFSYPYPFNLPDVIWPRTEKTPPSPTP